jgi:uncharacterized protein with von Willebrand factor type A (vWA) domain
MHRCSPRREMSDDLVSKMVEFCAHLRREHAFNIGPRESLEALKALEIVDARERSRFAAALRAICCSRPEEIEPFARAFAAFFTSATQGVRQPRRARRERAESRDAPATAEPMQMQRHPDAESSAQVWQALLARYSPSAAAHAQPLSIPIDGLDAARTQANRLVRHLQLGRSLRWKPQPRGERFDLRRTLRASLRSGGDLLEPHTLGHPLRNPRFVLLLDGSRSMSEQAPRMLQFAYALCERTRRARAFLFSTQLREITRALRDAARARTYRLDDLGEAWGGGTRIGASLSEFVREHGANLNDQTFAIVISDGLDVGEIPRLARAMREIARRCAAVAWVNPHAGRPGYTPSARGMRAALPYVTSLISFEQMAALTKLGRRMRVTKVA